MSSSTETVKDIVQFRNIYQGGKVVSVRLGIAVLPTNSGTVILEPWIFFPALQAVSFSSLLCLFDIFSAFSLYLKLKQ